MHEHTFDHITPTDRQLGKMTILREAAKQYCAILEKYLPEGEDRDAIIRSHRTNAMWANVCVTRHADGRPRSQRSEAT